VNPLIILNDVDLIKEIDLMKHRLDVMISVGSLADDMQTEVYLCVRSEGH